MSYRTQWTQVIFGAFGSGASGSSTIRARDRDLAGTPFQERGGETLSPSHVYLAGIAPPGAKADDVRMKDMVKLRRGSSSPILPGPANPGHGKSRRKCGMGEGGQGVYQATVRVARGGRSNMGRAGRV